MKNEAIAYLDSLVTEDTPKKQLDLLAFIKKCVRECNDTSPRKSKNSEHWEDYFEKLWKLYPRKVNKILAKKTFEHKIRGLSDEECLEKCKKIYRVQSLRQKEWKDNGTEMQYIQHYSSFLNSQVPNSPHYKGR